ncbi:hypothetical protein HJG60_011700 [Phyllostomus discolor]|uniref:Uncharacterized protein n=1 Tax=Phyllostomus discolor TaxID=89673 RepID=A0A833ZUB4_9CHIR|nr:hypothetical protein HJG60_011700 [Phyllostomus discolor]
MYFSQFWGLEGIRLRCRSILFWARTLSLTCRVSLCLPTAEKEGELCVFSYKHTSFLDLGLILMSSFNLSHFLIGPISKHSNIGGEASACTFGRAQTFGPLCVLRELQTTVQGGDTYVKSGS